MSINLETARSLARGRGKVYDALGDKIGTIGQVYVDDETGQPNWVTVRTGLFGLAESFVPLHGSRVDGDDLYVHYRESQVKDAPRIDPDGSLSPAEEERLFTFYDSFGEPEQDRDPDSDGDAPRSQRLDHSAADSREGDAVRDAERSGRGPEPEPQQDRGGQRLRLRKYVVTEEATLTVPVQREEVRLEPEQAGDESGLGLGTDTEDRPRGREER